MRNIYPIARTQLWRSPRLLIATIVVLGMVASSCSDRTPRESLGDGALGTVEVARGGEIQIRSLYTSGGDILLFGNSTEKAVLFAVDDYGPIHGFGVNVGMGLDDLCSSEGGMIGGSLIVAEGDVVGVIGTNCSVAAAEASPLITNAGMVLISPGNTASSLTSDLAGNEGGSHFAGYYRTAHNDLVQGESVAHFLFGQGITSAAVVHDGGPYTSGLASAFSNAFEEQGGTVTGAWEVGRTDEDLVPVLTEIAAGAPRSPILPTLLADRRSPGPAGSRDTRSFRNRAGDRRRSDQRLLPGLAGNRGYVHLRSRHPVRGQRQSDHRLEHDRTPTPFRGDGRRGACRNILGSRLRRHDPAAGCHRRFAYVRTEDGVLVIDRAGLREYLDNLSGFQGVTGVLSCDEFGDCGGSRVVIYEHSDSTDIDATFENVVFEVGPESGGSRASLATHEQ